jgi:hypothetical protein
MNVPMAQLSFAFLCVISACSAVLHLKARGGTLAKARNRVQNYLITVIGSLLTAYEMHNSFDPEASGPLIALVT